MLSEPLRRKVVAVACALEGCGIPYAVGGAIAFGYAAEPRGTTDIDINIFLATRDSSAVLECLAGIGIPIDISTARAEIESREQARFYWDETAIDLFFAYHEFHDSCATRAVLRPFDEITIPVLSAEDILVLKALFNRPKDWLDIEQIVLTRSARLDVAYVLNWLDAMVGPEDSVRRRVAEMVARAASG